MYSVKYVLSRSTSLRPTVWAPHGGTSKDEMRVRLHSSARRLTFVFEPSGSGRESKLLIMYLCDPFIGWEQLSYYDLLGWIFDHSLILDGKTSAKRRLENGLKGSVWTKAETQAKISGLRRGPGKCECAARNNYAEEADRKGVG